MAGFVGICSAEPKTAQVGVARLGDPPQSCLTTAAVLPGDKADPGGDLAPVI